MKKLLSVFLAIFLFATLTACGGNDTPESSDNGGTSNGSGERVALLYADFTQGGSEENVKTYEMPYTGDLTPDMLMNGLTELTGLTFDADITTDDKGIWVDWDSASSLFAGPGQEQKDEFAFYDNYSLSWFMMDSLWRTLRENLGGDIYYTEGLGGYLVFEDLQPIDTFPNDTPYMGSAFYFAHANVKGDDDHAFVYTDLTAGNPEREDAVEAHEIVDFGELTPEVLVRGLEEVTDLYFAVEISTDENGDIWVDWDETSSLFAGPSDNQSEEFFFYDNVNFNWFMLDSLWTTLVRNYNAEVYYTMNGGLPLYIEYHDPIQTIPNDMPYQGSSFYYAHSDNVG